ncbi:hypothetical protein OsI_23176 [Oryza sativa Indica Group]|nr:hypothetical protein OsI_23176 [Oryza sativa Indica Group]
MGSHHRPTAGQCSLVQPPRLITCLLLLLLLLLLSSPLTLPCSASSAVITHLPGFHGRLPFYLETGYIGVEEKTGTELFYYFVESERNPDTDPLVLWLVGGPRCSGFCGVVYEEGPLNFLLETYNGSSPRLVYNQYSWTQMASIIFLDSPVGSGFSYARDPNGYDVGDISSSLQVVTFMKEWLNDHPRYCSHNFYVGGASYAGKVVPVITQYISEGSGNTLQRRFCEPNKPIVPLEIRRSLGGQGRGGVRVLHRSRAGGGDQDDAKKERAEPGRARFGVCRIRDEEEDSATELSMCRSWHGHDRRQAGWIPSSTWEGQRNHGIATTQSKQITRQGRDLTSDFVGSVVWGGEFTGDWRRHCRWRAAAWCSARFSSQLGQELAAAAAAPGGGVGVGVFGDGAPRRRGDFLQGLRLPEVQRCSGSSRGWRRRRTAREAAVCGSFSEDVAHRSRRPKAATGVARARRRRIGRKMRMRKRRSVEAEGKRGSARSEPVFYHC